MKPLNREIVLVYSQEEMLSKVEELKMRGYQENDIHVLVDDDSVLGAVDNDRNIQTHETGSIGSKFKSFFTGKDTVREELKKLDLEQREIDDYQENLENGAILLYTEQSSREDDNYSSFGDDARPIDSDEVKRNTAMAPFGRDIERDDLRHNDAPIRDKDVSTDLGTTGIRSDEIYTTEVPREEQYGLPSYGDKTQDSRLKGDSIHPTTGSQTADESLPEEKLMEHEPGLGSAAGGDILNTDDGVHRRQDDQSPGVDPNLGPAPFGRDSEEEHLLNDRNDDFEKPRSPREGKTLHEEADKKPGTPPTPKLF
ncbi:general stress protein [Planococcus shenhongbingii]|uniref:General stress protein n=1 Tax=Planococcus shenhongbingii TaxID=3058398 RepID=A0ABT8N996_9BACL|nr:MULTISPECIES: general stress protein [unclassified Planococcus (in: firmicutes)]MDN7244456.1 general stress protein [Planococcus sp. N017]WKA57618.1 general stress protein [Planococcus sp. N016]